MAANHDARHAYALSQRHWSYDHHSKVKGHRPDPTLVLKRCRDSRQRRLYLLGMVAVRAHFIQYCDLRRRLPFLQQVF